MNAPLHSHIPYDPFAERPLPGVQPLEMADWLVIDETFAGQMAERERRLADPGARFLRLLPGAEAAAEELLDTVLGQAYPGAGAQVERPDGTVVTVDRARPMETLGRLVQEDLCLMQKRGDAHVLTAAVLCFPASWRLED